MDSIQQDDEEDQDGFEEDSEYLVQLLKKCLLSKRQISNSLLDKNEFVDKLIGEIDMKKALLKGIITNEFPDIKEENDAEEREHEDESFQN